MKTINKNSSLYKLIVTAEKQSKKAPIWGRLADELKAPSRRARDVNVSKLHAVCDDKESVLVPGKVLAGGNITKAINVVAVSVSSAAEKKIIQAGGKVTLVADEMKANPTGAKLRIIG